ncbi:hypothetical protein SAMN05428959_103305 [Duganella sp. CF517]|uniref:cyanobactin maturation protease PatG family protein n=1 Tax=Duganella sp. CF517 TaxID=1881038 RepID=UPI0008C4F11A|nr:hypothetical protein [Duganella sp. CF517]SEN82521.1 hypothetical protein SAMN05428959_103305 [Duganella sp. CF517]
MIEDSIVEVNKTQGQLAAAAGAAPPCGCQAGREAPEGFVYAVGRLEPRFPSLSVEKEFNQAAARLDTQGLSERQRHQTVLSLREHRYLVRQVCWVFSVQGLETYLVQLGDGGDYDLLTGSLRERPSPNDIDVVVGRRLGLSSPAMCNGLVIPILRADQIYSFDRDSLIDSLPVPEDVPREKFDASAREMLEQMMLLSDNVGASDEHRALNYLSLRYSAVYHLIAGAHARNLSLTGVTVRPSKLSQSRSIMDVVLAFTNRQTDVVEKFIVRVDVTEQFPFLATKLSPYFDM